MKRITTIKNLTIFSMGGGGGGGEGYYGPLVGFSYTSSKKVCNREMKLSDL